MLLTKTMTRIADNIPSIGDKQRYYFASFTKSKVKELC